jgi:DNA recombination protein RmuC
MVLLATLAGAIAGAAFAWVLLKGRTDQARVEGRMECIQRLAILETDNASGNQRLQEVQAALERVTTELASQRDKSADLQSARAKADEALNGCQEAAESMEHELREQLVQLREQIKTLEGSLAGALADTDRQKSAHADSQASLAKAQEALLQRNTSAERMEQELREQLTLSREQIRSHEQSLAESLAEVEALKSTYADLQSSMAKTKETLEQRNAAAALMEQELREQLILIRGQAQDLENELTDAMAETGTLKSVNAELLARAEEREQAFEEARNRLQETFRSHAAQALQANSEAFLQLARTTLQQSQTEAKGDLETRQTAIAALLEPLKQGLSDMDQQMRGLREARNAGDAQLQIQIQGLAETQQRLQGETGRLANALRKPSVRGRWGELQLQNLVELAGMKEHVDFLTQVSLKVDEDRRRPDMLIRMPGGKCVAVDAKTPMGAYLDALEAASEEEKQGHLARLPELIRTHVSQLADKRYYEGLAQSPDFVVLFLHGEGPFALACEKDPNLLQDALRQNVLLATPVTLIALLKSAAFGWQQQRIQDNAEQIRATAAELIKRLAGMTGHIASVGEGLGKAIGSYNAFAGNLERMVMPQARRIQALGVQAYRKKGELIELPVLEPLQEAPRLVDVEQLASLATPGPVSHETEPEA